MTLDNPSKHFSLLQQLGGCGHPPALPSVSGRAYELSPRPIHYVPPGFNTTFLEELNNLTTQQYNDVKDLGCQVKEIILGGQSIYSRGPVLTKRLHCYGLSTPTYLDCDQCWLLQYHLQ